MNIKTPVALALYLNLVACSPIVTHRPCETAMFAADANMTDISYFDTWGYIEKHCPTDVPERFTYKIGAHSTVNILIQQETIIRLSAFENGNPVMIRGEGIDQNYPLGQEEFTHFVRADRLRDNTLALKLPNGEGVKLRFQFVTCTCVDIDAI